MGELEITQENMLTEMSNKNNQHSNLIRLGVNMMAQEIGDEIKAKRTNTEEAIGLGIQAAVEMTLPGVTKSKITKGLERQMKKTENALRNSLREAGTSVSTLINSPIETLSKLFQIDQAVAAEMLRILGITTQHLAVSASNLGDIRTATSLVDGVGALLLMSQVDDKHDNQKVPRPLFRAPRSVVGSNTRQILSDVGEKGKNAGSAVKNVAIAVGGVVGTAACVGLAWALLRMGTDKGFAVNIEALAVKPTATPTLLPPPTPPPRETSEALMNNITVEGKYADYRDSRTAQNFDPFDMDSPTTQLLIAFKNWNWWFIPGGGENSMDSVFGEKFDSEQMKTLKSSPDSFFGLLSDLITKAERENKTTEAEKLKHVYDIYKQRQEFKGSPDDFLRQLKKSKLFLSHPGLLAMSQELFEKIGNMSTMIRGENYHGRKGSFAGTQLPKSEILRRQKRG